MHFKFRTGKHSMRHFCIAHQFRGLKNSVFVFVLSLIGFQCGAPLNHPYPDTRGKNWHLIAMASEPSTMDPVRMHDAPSFSVASNLALTPFQYSYLKRPISMEPYLARSMPEIRHGLRGKSAHFFELDLKRHYYAPVEACLQDTHHDGKGRPVLAQDIELSLKRNADPANEAFMFSLLASSIQGFSDYNEYIRKQREAMNVADLEPDSQADALAQIYSQPIQGVEVLSESKLRIYLTGASDRILYFFAMVSSAPIPWNCWKEYNAREKNQHALERRMIASGPFYLVSWEPRDKIILEKNPLYDFRFPELPGDSTAWPSGLKENPGRVSPMEELAGSPLPLSDRIIFYLIQSGSTVWTLFEQGYQDRVALTKDSYEGVLEGGKLRAEYRERGITLSTEAELTTFGWIFNLDDPVIGAHPGLRKALRCAIDAEELINRFYEGRAIVAHGLIPPGMEGFQSKSSGRDCDSAQIQRWLAQSGYPEGKDPSNGQPLVLRLIDVPRPASASFHSYLVEQVAKLGIRLQIDLFDAPTYFEKRMKGKFQITTWGWGADYPDPQNFFQLFYGPNAGTPYNESEFQDPGFDQAYRQLEKTDDPVRRQELIQVMNQRLYSEVPVLLLFHRINYGISQPWLSAYEPHPMGYNMLQYRGVNPTERDAFQDSYNSLW